METNENTSDKAVEFTEVAQAEREQLNHKRAVIFGSHLPVEDLPEYTQPAGSEPTYPPLPAGTTVGLALSGGGIRSATFSLGVLQVLARMKLWNRPELAAGEVSKDASKNRSLLDRVDYLSTVSGGGYIGAWLAASYLRIKDKPQTAESSPNSHLTEPSPTFLGEDSNELHHLRAYSHYLAPEPGAMKPDTWTMATIWARNTLLIQLLVGCCIVSILLVKRLGAEVFGEMAGLIDVTGSVVWRSPMWLSAVAVGVLTLLIALTGMAREISRFVKGGFVDAQKQRRVVLQVVVPFMISAWCLGFALWTAYYARLVVGNQCDWTLRENYPQGTERWLGMTIIALIFGVIGAWMPFANFDKTKVWRRIWLSSCAFSGAAMVSLGIMVALDGLMVKLQAPKPAAQTEQVAARSGEVSAVLTLKGNPASGLPANALAIGPVKLAIAQSPDHATTQSTDEKHSFLRNVLRCHLGLWLLGGLLFMATILIGLMGRDMTDEVREWLSRLAAWLWIFLFIWLCLHLLALVAPRVAMRLYPFDEYFTLMQAKGLTFGAVAAWFGTTVMSALVAKSPDTGDSSCKPPLWKNLLAKLGPYVALVGLLVFGSIVAHMVVGRADPLTATLNWRTPICLALFLGLSWLWLQRVDLNEFSMNHFYRNRLVRCYLGGSRVTGNEESLRKPHPFTGFDFDDDLPLARFAREPDEATPLYDGPYPIITAALNSSKGGDLATQERRAEAFIFSPLFVGSWFARARTEGTSPKGGYRATLSYANADVTKVLEAGTGRQTGNQQSNGLTLGTCMSISGAAVSPNCGYHTSPVTAFLLTVVNARMGWWLPSPWGELKGIGAEPKGPFKWLRPLVSELTGTVSTQCPFIYTSDGGHFENLGIYELVRRRCGFIIVVDGEQDRDFSFHGMGTAIRRCRVDFNTEINLDLTSIRTETVAGSGYRKGHCAVGRIIYPAEDGHPLSVGVIVYLKSSLTGDEPEDIRQYRTQFPEFPHETTRDQSFSESQFESYRRLGQHVAKEVLEVSWNQARRRPDGIPGFAETLLGCHTITGIEEHQMLGT